MRIVEFIEGKKDPRREELTKFVDFVSDKLGLEQGPPSIEFSNDKEHAQHFKTFGYHDTGPNSIWVYIGNRNLADIMRTTAHELVHAKQREQGRLDNDPHAGRTGSEQENEANSVAGVIMREYGQENPHIFESRIR
jgi:hypothetical protein